MTCDYVNDMGMHSCRNSRGRTADRSVEGAKHLFSMLHALLIEQSTQCLHDADCRSRALSRIYIVQLKLAGSA